jgi:tetratricopeptide (TPR) repeat protein
MSNYKIISTNTQKYVESILKDADVLYKTGELYLHNTDYASAEKMFTLALEYNPTNINSLAQIGYSRLLSREIKDATMILAEAEALDPLNQLVLRNIGLVHWKTDEFELAEDYFKICLKIYPNDAVSLGYLGQIYADQSNSKSAMHLIVASLIQFAENEGADVKGVEDCEEIFKNTSKLNKSIIIRLLETLSKIFLNLDMPEKAIPILKMVLNLSSDDLHYFNSTLLTLLGLAHYLNGNSNKATDTLSKALIIDPNNREALDMFLRYSKK